MFVRWKKRQLSSDTAAFDTPNISLYAVLVKNHRIDGKTRQKVVKYLGYINEASLEDSAHQERFWQQVRGNLDEMGMETEQEEYQKIIAKLAETVPHPAALPVPCSMSATDAG